MSGTGKIKYPELTKTGTGHVRSGTPQRLISRFGAAENVSFPTRLASAEDLRLNYPPMAKFKTNGSGQIHVYQHEINIR